MRAFHTMNMSLIIVKYLITSAVDTEMKINQVTGGKICYELF